MKLALLALALLFGLAWGIVQGMVMVQPGDARAVKRRIDEYRPEGVRNHQWFGLYHWACVVMMLLGLATAMAWDIGRPGILWSLGCIFLGWEASELGYGWTRWAKWLPVRERLTALDAWSRSIEGALVKYIHVARVAAGIVFLTVGGVC